MISESLRTALHANLDEQLRLLEMAAQEAASNTGAMLPAAAAKHLGYKDTSSIRRLVAEGKLVKVDGKITMQSISDYLGTTPHARRRKKRTVERSHNAS